jgi:hypothetical protein
MDRNGPAPEPRNRSQEPTRALGPTGRELLSLPPRFRMLVCEYAAFPAIMCFCAGLLAKIGSVAGPVA